MCGIAGFVHGETSWNVSAVVSRMIAVQKHRGPDGEALHTSPGATLGHCRLAIIDTSNAGQQPMSDPQRRFWITFNGEIYNYIELAEELRGAGHQFRSTCDTEVLLAAYCEWGAECLHRLRGMFAFAVWDEQERRLFAARDRLGIKPFHYWTNARQTELAFASELKALLGFLPERSVNTRLVREFLAWSLLDHDPAETMVQGVLRLPAGHYLTWEREKGINLRRYWSVEVSEELTSSAGDRRRLVAEFRDRFMESVSLHLRSDVPVGSCLSGGLDSSSIVCAVSAELRARGVKRNDWQHTFSACFDDPRLDERSYMAPVTRATQSQNHQVFPSGEQLAREMDTWLWHQEEPVGGSGVYAQYCVTRLAREHGIKVLLDGQGADEQLAGYRKFILVYLHQLFSAGQYWRGAREATAFLSSWEILRTSKLAQGWRYRSGAAPEWPGLWTGKDPPPRPADLGLHTSLGRRLHADITKFSLPLLLRYDDRNSMAFGVESRVPFVDHVLVEWIARLPADLRLHNGWTKSILREALADVLPPIVLARKSKLGFSTPESQWLRGPLRGWLHEMLERPAHLGEIVESSGVAHLLDRLQRNTSSAASDSVLFRLAVYENWARLFMARESARMPEAAGW